jgi:chitinase
VADKVVHGHSYPDGDSGEGLVHKFIDLAHRSGVKVLLSISGTGRFNAIAEDEKKRGLFTEVMTAFVEKYDYDGIEIDWEHTIELPLHADLMKSLRIALNRLGERETEGRRKYYLTTALHSWQRYDWDLAERLSEAVDWINIMTYDLGMVEEVPQHNTPLNVMEEHLSVWESAGFDASKLCIGLANYGFIYRGIKPGEKSSEELKEKVRYISWVDAENLIAAGWKEVFDPKAKAFYYFSPDGNDFVTIDNRISLDYKLDWIMEKKYGCVFWFEFHSDYHPPTPGDKFSRHTLIDYVAERIRRERLNLRRD